MDGFKSLENRAINVIDTSSALSIKSLAVSDTITVNDGAFPKVLKPITTYQILTPTFNVVYRNTLTTPLFISVSFTPAVASEAFTFYCDVNVNPTTLVMQISSYSNSPFMFVIVLPNHYYYFTRSSSGTINKWIQYS
jgi:hypothetical protein